MASAQSLVVLFSLLSIVQPSAANVSLAKSNATSWSRLLNESSIKQLLLEEVYGFMGRGHVDLQLPGIQKDLEPMWLSLPKNSYGNLEGSQVKYALHRFFVHRHGWHIDGLDRVGGAVGQSSPAGLLRERVPAFLMEVFEEAFGQTGLQLHELAVFAATLEHIIHDEATDRLTDVYEALSTSIDDRLSDKQVDVAADVYMMSLLLGLKRLKSPGTIEAKLAKLAKAYPGWSDTQVWLRDVRHTVAHLKQGAVNPFVENRGMSFKQVEGVVEEVSRRFGRFQDTECRHLKDTLLEAEERDTGRVLLSDFYKKGLENGKLFKENVDYLRDQGALDESKPGEPRVIVSNFILSPGNCLADTGFYSICCINECDGLLAHLEKTIAAPEATPERIVAEVSKLSSSSVEAPRVLSDRLVSQIELVAMRHGGKVPLHSRSLAQWLHVAFPQECPFPMAASSASSMSTRELKASYHSSKLNAEEREQYIDSMQQQKADQEATEEDSAGAEEELLSKWSHEEEILYLSPDQQPRKWGALFGKAVLGSMVFLGGAAAVADAVRRFKGREAVGAGRKEKSHLV